MAWLTALLLQFAANPAFAAPIWSGSVSGNLGGPDANFTGDTFAQALALRSQSTV